MLIVPVKLRNLTANPNNPRKSYKKDSIIELAQTIKENGLLQPICAKKIKGNKREAIYGSRRYHAMMHLVEIEAEGWTLDTEVQTIIAESLTDQQAKTMALVENEQREDMHPVDQADAYADLAKSGMELADIAAKAGKSEMTVRRRLAVASLCAPIKQALRKGEITLSVAEAMTIGTVAQQKEVLALVQRRSWMTADQVRDHLTEDRACVADAIFPIEQYKGRIASDLFQTETTSYFDDAEQFLTLQKQAVTEKAEAFRQDGATFVEIFEDWHFPSSLYATSKAKRTGVVIHLTPNGKVEIHEGLRRIEQVVKSVSRAIKEDNARVRPEYADPVKRYINAHKTAAVQAAILASPRTARVLAIVGMMATRENMNVSLTRSAGIGFFNENADTTSASYQMIEQQARGFAQLLGAEADSIEHNGSGIEWLLSHHNEAAIYDLCKPLTDAELEALHLFLTTLTFGAESMTALDGDPNSLFNRVANDLGVNMVECWRPDSYFLAKRNRPQLEAIMKEAGMNGVMPQAKKSEIVAIAAARFAAGEAEETRNWLPGAMQFPATGPDVREPYRNDDDDQDGEDEGEGDDFDHDDAEAYAEAAE